MKCKRQNNEIESNSNNKTAVDLLLNLVKKPNIFIFFQTAYALHCDISKQLVLKKKIFIPIQVYLPVIYIWFLVK